MVFAGYNYEGPAGLGGVHDSFDAIPEAIMCINKDASADYYELFDRIDGVKIDLTLYGIK